MGQAARTNGGLSTARNAGATGMSCPANIQGADKIGIVFEAARHTLEFGLRRTVSCVGLPAVRARLAGVGRRYSDQPPASPGQASL